MIPKFYDETFLTSLGIEVHRRSMDEKAEKNEDMKSSELQPGRELLMRLSLLSTHRACWFYLLAGSKLLEYHLTFCSSLNFPSASYLDERTADV